MEWKPITGYEGIYEINEAGDVRSLDRIITRKGKTADLRGKPLASFNDTYSQRRVTLCRDGRPKQHQVARLVLIAFDRDGGENEVVNYGDGDKQNVHVSNLRWTTMAEISHASEKVQRGDVHHKAKLDWDKVAAIRASSETNRALAERYGVTIMAISNARNGKNWKRRNAGA